MSKLKNKVAVVTGASKGIGAGIAKARAAEGASVVVNYSSSKEGADRVVAEIAQSGGKALAVQGDVAKASDVQRIFAETKKAFGKLDVLVNNAGVYQFEAQTPLGRIGQPDDIAPIAVFLASSESGWLTGETLLASGGMR
jgi:3-oxoacyl-[acyl-carrier protein] reductase